MPFYIYSRLLVKVQEKYLVGPRLNREYREAAVKVKMHDKDTVEDIDNVREMHMGPRRGLG